MTYALITSHAGHTVGGGARGCGYEESMVARQFNDLLIKAFKNIDQAVVDTTDNVGKTQIQNLNNLIRNCNAHSKNGRLDISLHLNAGGGTGVEVLYYDQRNLAAKVSAAIARTCGFKDRGPKQRKDLAVLKGTNAPAILIELCFVDNASDMKKLMDNLQTVAKAIVEEVTGRVVRTVSKAKYIVTGGLKPDAIREFSQYICERNWWAKLEFSDGIAIATTGVLGELALEEFKFWLDNREWWYEIKEV